MELGSWGVTVTHLVAAATRMVEARPFVTFGAERTERAVRAEEEERENIAFLSC